jgi:O-antigen ligase
VQGFYSLKDMIQTPLGRINFIVPMLEFGLLYELLSRRRWWVVFALLDGGTVLLSFSRGGLLATGFTLALTSVLALGVRGQRRVSLITAATLALSALVLAVTPALRVLLQAFAIVGRTAANRLELWHDAWQAAAWRPLTGVGYGAYEVIGTQRDVHNLVFALLAETGVPGLALLAGAVLAAAGRVLRAAADPRTGARRGEALGLSAGLAVVLAHSMFDPFFEGFSLIWVAAVFAWIMGPWPRDPSPAARLSPAAAPAAIAAPS